ncbi:MAG TPA: hypothetical protein VMG30_08710 [Acidobacteriota bacterium]|nr:hypothetical protein [Acidobacteriota bacterium]
MKNSIGFFVVISLLILVACYSCGAPSSEAEMKAAQAAMDNAKSLHADTIAASSWNDAIVAWDQGEAAVKEGKSAKSFYLRAKSRFEKAAAIAKANGELMSREVSQMQVSIEDSLSKIKAELVKGRLSAKIQKQVKPMVEEAEKGLESLGKLVADKDFMKAKTLAKEIQAKVFNARLIAAGKKPVY